MPDAALGASFAAPGKVIGLVGMYFFRSMSGTAMSVVQRRDLVKHGFQHLGIMHICRCESNHKRNPVQICKDMVFTARTAPIYRIWTGFFAPLFACMTDASIQALDQSIFFASCKCCKITSSIFSQTPACCQSRSLLQQVIPLPHPISCGRSSHGMPVFNTNTTPVKAARLEMGGRPPFGLGGRAGMIGSINSHNSSLTNFFAITHHQIHFITLFLVLLDVLSLPYRLTEYDDTIARHVLDTVKVLGQDRLLVIFKGGAEVEQTIEY